MRRIVVIFLALQLVHGVGICPPESELIRDGECRGNYTRISTTGKEGLKTVISKCSEIQAHPVYIHNYEQQSYWIWQSQMTDEKSIIMGLMCDVDSKKWIWSDGSEVDYKTWFYAQDLDRDCNTEYTWVIGTDGLWNF
ncbi:hypothetical protein PMAYCL1PPCAC_27078, partial [Pristionchus mayeri]